MLIKELFRSRALVVVVLASFGLLVAPVGQFAAPRGPASSGSLVGFVYGSDMKTPVTNAVVKLRNVADSKEYVSPPTDANGMYKVTGLADGRYILGVTTAKGDFNFDYVMKVKGGEMAKLSVALAPGGQTTGTDAGKKSFFVSPAGIVLIVVAVGTVLYAVFAKEEEASPIR